MDAQTSPLGRYFDARRAGLHALAKAAGASHHGLRGQARELLVEHFLREHIPAAICIGYGEVVGARWCCDGQPSSLSSEIDIVLYRCDYPVLHVNGPKQYLIEGVIGTVEVKSRWSRSELESVFRHADAIAEMPRCKTATLQMSGDGPKTRESGSNRRVLTAVVYLDGPSSRSEVLGTLEDLHARVGYGPDLVYSLSSGLIVKRGAIDVLPATEDENPTLWRSMYGPLFGGADHPESTYQRVFGDEQRWQGLNVLMLEIAERCQRYAAGYSRLGDYVACQ